MSIAVRPMTLAETVLMIRYFLEADEKFIRSFGGDPAKLPREPQWRKLLEEDFARPPREKSFYYLTWELDGEPVGHSNINKIKFGKEAYMHLHLWRPDSRRRGLGLAFVQQSIPCYFREFKLQTLYSEPYAENPAPNATLPRAGFEFVKKYETVPGWINFRQFVNRWQYPREKFERENMDQCMDQ